MFWLFLWPFRRSRNFFWRLISTAKVFYREQWKNLAQRLQRQNKIEIKEHLPVPGSHITDDFTAVRPKRICLFFGSVFQFGFLKVKSLLFPEMCNFEFTLHRCKPTRNWFFSRWSVWPIDQIKDWPVSVQLRTSIQAVKLTPKYCKMALKYPFKLISSNVYLWIYDKMTAPQASNSVNGRDKWFKTFLKLYLISYLAAAGPSVLAVGFSSDLDYLLPWRE